MTKRPNELAVGVCALGLVASACATGGASGASGTTTDGFLPATPDQGRPNILFIFSDDHATHAISAYGSKINQTPNLDRIANEGMRFDNAFVTNSICAPSRAVILTGKHSHKNGHLTNHETFNGAQRTFPKLMQKAGYATALIGKWHLRSDPTGFDHWEILDGQGSYYNPKILSKDGETQIEGYVTDITVDRTLEWLEKGRDKSKPFILMSQHKAPHRSWQPGPDHLHTYEDVEIPEPPDLFDDYRGRASAARTQHMSLRDDLNAHDLKFLPPAEMNPAQLKMWNDVYGPRNLAVAQTPRESKDRVRWMYQRYIKDYLRTVASVDDGVGRVLAYLEESGLAKNTVVVYSSDQGFYLGDHGWFDKRFMYEQSLRTPLLVRWPGVIKPGSVNTDLVQNLDFAQTFLELAGARQPADMQGISLAPLLHGNTPGDWRKSIYYHYYEYPGSHDIARHYGVRTQTHKLIHYYELGEWELFDLQRDPREMRSRYLDPAYAGIAQDLKAELDRLRMHYDVTPESEPPSLRDEVDRDQRALLHD